MSCRLLSLVGTASAYNVVSDAQQTLSNTCSTTWLQIAVRYMTACLLMLANGEKRWAETSFSFAGGHHVCNTASQRGAVHGCVLGTTLHGYRGQLSPLPGSSASALTKHGILGADSLIMGVDRTHVCLCPMHQACAG